MRFITPKNKGKKISSGKGSLSILLSLSAAHFLNDALQMVVPAIYPMLKTNYQLSFTEIGMITLVFQLTASIFQPIVGTITDKKPQPYSLAIGMSFSLVGLLCLAFAGSFTTILLSVVLVGAGSAVFHPESSRMARYASGGKAGTAQSIFQVGGNTGTSVGPLLAAVLVIPFGQEHVASFSVLAFLAIIILWQVGKWFKKQSRNKSSAINTGLDHIKALPKKKVILALSILLVLIFSKFFYLAAMKNYLTFYMINYFGVSVQSSQLYLFVFLFSVAAGTMIGGPLGDKYGRKRVIWFSILGAAPFTLLLPYASLFWTIILIAIIGVILASAFPAIIIYGQELIPHKLGMVSGLFFGLAFGMGAIGAGVLGILADKTSVYYMFGIVSYLPLLGICAALLPNIEHSDK
ncbi:MAG TPA: MFS transporter [Chitinophagaceae bacterium]|nr:MFS transporter [Chitinophagaceae bacterium]